MTNAVRSSKEGFLMRISIQTTLLFAVLIGSPLLVEAQQTDAPYLLSVNYPDGFVDPLEDLDTGTGAPVGINRLTVRFSEPVYDALSSKPGQLIPLHSTNFYLRFFRDGVELDDLSLGFYFDVRSGQMLNEYLLLLETPLPPSAWVLIQPFDVIDANGNFFITTNGRVTSTVGVLPLDVDGNGLVNPFDTLAWGLCVTRNTVPIPGMSRENFCDTDRSGGVQPFDAIRAAQLLHGQSTSAPWLGAELGRKPAINCSANTIPSADFEYLDTVDGASLFDASLSEDPDPYLDGYIVGWKWDFGDGTRASYAYAIASHTYSSPGTYTVTVTAYDYCGATRSRLKEVIIP